LRLPRRAAVAAVKRCPLSLRVPRSLATIGSAWAFAKGFTMSELRVQFGRRLRYLRRQKDLTQEQLAEAAGVSVDLLSYIEHGVNAPSAGAGSVGRSAGAGGLWEALEGIRAALLSAARRSGRRNRNGAALHCPRRVGEPRCSMVRLRAQWVAPARLRYAKATYQGGFLLLK
jgi:DNA-binding XRE family transcriptional regulator